MPWAAQNLHLTWRAYGRGFHLAKPATPAGVTMRDELERLAERWRSIAKHAGMTRAKAFVQCAHELDVALASRCYQPAGEPVPLPKAPLSWDEFWAEYDRRNPGAKEPNAAMREYAERVAAPLRERVADVQMRLHRMSENTASLVADLEECREKLLTAEREREADRRDAEALYEAASKGFHVSETCGPDGKYQYVSKFKTMVDLHAFHDAWVKVMVAVRDRRAAMGDKPTTVAEDVARLRAISDSIGGKDGE